MHFLKKIGQNPVQGTLGYDTEKAPHSGKNFGGCCGGAQGRVGRPPHIKARAMRGESQSGPIVAGLGSSRGGGNPISRVFIMFF